MFDDFDDFEEFCYDFLCTNEPSASHACFQDQQKIFVEKNQIQTIIDVNHEKKAHIDVLNDYTHHQNEDFEITKKAIFEDNYPNKAHQTDQLKEHNKDNTSFDDKQLVNDQNLVLNGSHTRFINENPNNIEHKPNSTDNDHAFRSLSIYNLYINPWRFRFQPFGQWENKQISIFALLKTHFQTRSTKKIRFEHKLWNALQLTSAYPELYNVLGVMLVTPQLIKADRDKIGAAFALTKPNAALFNQQGAFPSHGFIEVSQSASISKYKALPYLVENVDEMKVRLYAPKDPMISLFEHLQSCHWNSPNPITV